MNDIMIMCNNFLNGDNMMYYTCIINSPVGRLTAASDGHSLTGLWMERQKYFCDGLKCGMEEPALPIFDSVQNWVEAYFAGKQPQVDFSLAPFGSNFRKAVWKILCEIPYGHLTTYGAIAEQFCAQSGKTSMSAQAIGGAVAHNPISIVIPCHRVVGADGSLTGYAGGIDTKIALLELENVQKDRYYIPSKGTALQKTEIIT